MKNDHEGTMFGMDPCQLVWQVKEIGWLMYAPSILRDPCRLVRQVNQTPRLRSVQSSSPAGRAGRGRAPVGQGMARFFP